MNPSLSSDNIDKDVVEKWLDTSQTLHEWTRVFRLAKKIPWNQANMSQKKTS